MQTTNVNSTPAVTHKDSTPQADLLEMQRDFSVPVDRLFQAFAKADAVKIWWWPQDLYADRVELDFREGGRYFINMKGFEKGGAGMTGQFEEISENARIVMSDHFADENGNRISAGQAKMPGRWPETVYITFEFEAITKSSSRLSLYQQGVPNKLQADCKKGWSQMFDKLEKYLRH